ncbi:hypothetical protein LTR78_005155 [Recurvomyces mirabilis]|uniref:BZIP domain-containing protein n=1 Tax=Recurvomyces mirabilis TaxID=574656 RepID=A0AAE0WN78_9PEZI|nr:hypothetical protein LTR78_005155 [Recurvomyces mirabilis]KAK5157705.1 hypothetical protein LTS14_003627 [Recurvomyces mirabilis]
MSKRSTEQRSLDSSDEKCAAASAASASTVQHGLPAPPASSRPPSRVSLGQPNPAGFAVDLLPYASRPGDSSTLTSPASSTTRLAGVHAILNPPHGDELNPGRRRKAHELESPFPTGQALPPIAMGGQSARATPVLGRASPIMSFGGPPELAPRRILTPRSPSLHRAASLGQLQPPASTVTLQQEPGTAGAPPLPLSVGVPRPAYDYTSATPSAEAARRAGMTVGRSTRAPSGSASPSSSYSSYSQAEQTSPASQAMGLSAGGLNIDRQRHMGIPISSSSGGQNTYQMMTLETTSGTVQLPVDVQAASRVADEKRRRNAGASARFRQRRKEKEKEASVTIGRLEQQVKELGEDADFYRRERDYLSGMLSQAPGGDRHFPRPLSPRRRRSSSVMAGPSGGGGTGYMSATESGARSPEQRRNVRRRTSTLSLPQPPPPPSQFAAPQAGGRPHANYAAPGLFGADPLVQQTTQMRRPSGPLPPALARESLPTSTVLPPMQHGPPAPASADTRSQPQTGPWNPFATERRSTGFGDPRDSR